MLKAKHLANKMRWSGRRYSGMWRRIIEARLPSDVVSHPRRTDSWTAPPCKRQIHGECIYIIVYVFENKSEYSPRRCHQLGFVFCKAESEFLNILIILRFQVLTCSAVWCDKGDERWTGKEVEPMWPAGVLIFALGGLGKSKPLSM